MGARPSPPRSCLLHSVQIFDPLLFPLSRDVTTIDIDMVVLQMKDSDSDSYYYETPSTSSTVSVIQDLCSVTNFRLLFRVVVDQLTQLSQFGPAKAPQDQGLDQYQSRTTGGAHYAPDPLGLRSGDAPGPEYQQVLHRVISSVQATLVPSKVMWLGKLWID